VSRRRPGTRGAGAKPGPASTGPGDGGDRGSASPASGLAPALERALPPQVARWTALPSALLVTLAVHYVALRTFFAQDDLVFLAGAAGLEPSPASLWRALSGTLRWRLFHAWFGVDPLPYHVVNLAFHLLNVALVYATARRLFAGRGTAWAAAVLFGVSAIAFTPLHWASGLGEIIAGTFALAALWLHLAARGAGAAEAGGRRERPMLLWVSAAAVLAAGLTKEVTLLLPLVLLAADRRLGAFAPRARSLLPAGAAGLLFAAGYAATFHASGPLGGDAYAWSLSPVFLAQNLATYLRWTVALGDPVRDAVARMAPGAWPLGTAVALAAVLALASQRRGPRHPEEVGAVWFLALLAPVLPLRSHTYLYYLYVPWAGACWLLAGTGARLTRRFPAALPVALLALVAFTGVEGWSVRARERAKVGPFAADRTIRESTLLGNAIRSLAAARLAPGSRVAFVNPAPRERVSVTGAPVASVSSYNPLERAMGGGRTLRLLLPNLRYLGFADTLPRDWEDAEVFLYEPDGRARHIGRGSPALVAAGTYALESGQWAWAEAMFRRALARGDTLPDAVYGLANTRSLLGSGREAAGFARDFLRRWPGDPRAREIAEGFRRAPGAK
jgi:hypothetical protein